MQPTNIKLSVKDDTKETFVKSVWHDVGEEYKFGMIS